jgi:thiamine biosynthesis lipoprotein
MRSFVFEAIGTRWQIDIDFLPEGAAFIDLEKKIRTRIDEFDSTYSRFRGDSFIRKLAKTQGTYILPEDSGPLFDLYGQLYHLTKGRFTPLIGKVLEDAGYDEQYSLQPKALQKPVSWEEAISIHSGKIVVKLPCLLDFGAAGKGYLIDLIGGILEKNGVETYCIDAGGDIRYRSLADKMLRVGLENPENSGQVIGVAVVGNESICASAGNRRKWGKFHHIIDPFTLSSPGIRRYPAAPGAPLSSVKATWVISSSTMIADGLATCLFFVDADVLLKRYGFEYVVLYSDFSVRKSEGFAGELYFKDQNKGK